MILKCSITMPSKIKWN